MSKASKHQGRTFDEDRAGIPDSITIESVRQWVKPRITARRFGHIEGVVEVAKQLAAKAHCSVFQAELAAWLHDACKEVKDKQLVEQAKLYYLALDPILERYGYLLHGPVAAEVAKRELAIGNREVLDAIAQHTLGAIGMTDLSKVIFLADCLEPSRPKDYTDPIWKALDFDKSFNLDRAIVTAIDLGLKFLIEESKPIHPKTVAVRNYYLTESA